MSTTQEETVREDPAELLEPGAQVKVRRFGSADAKTEMEFVQRPLSFFGKLDFFSVMGKALDRAMAGPDGISLADLLEAPDNATELREADTFVRGVAKLASYSPDIFGDLYCVILAVPKGHRQFVKDVMEQGEDRGGFSDKLGIDILNMFVDQNYEAISGFFTEHLAGLAGKIQAKMPKEKEEEKGGKSQSSKRSKTTPLPIPSR